MKFENKYDPTAVALLKAGHIIKNKNCGNYRLNESGEVEYFSPHSKSWILPAWELSLNGSCKPFEVVLEDPLFAYKKTELIMQIKSIRERISVTAAKLLGRKYKHGDILHISKAIPALLAGEVLQDINNNFIPLRLKKGSVNVFFEGLYNPGQADERVVSTMDRFIPQLYETFFSIVTPKSEDEIALEKLEEELQDAEEDLRILILDYEHKNSSDEEDEEDDDDEDACYAYCDFAGCC